MSFSIQLFNGFGLCIEHNYLMAVDQNNKVEKVAAVIIVVACFRFIFASK